MPQLDWLFAVPLFQQRMEGFSSHNVGLIEFLRELKGNDRGVSRSNVGGWHSSDLRPHGNTAEIAWLLETVSRFANQSLAQLSSGGAEIEVVFDAVWAIINRSGDWNTPHNHLPSQWSGVCYLQVSEQSSEARDGNLVLIDPVALGPRHRNPINVFITPRNGGIFLFPAYLAHMVAPHHAPGERIVVSFNMHVQQTLV